jgi:hypothetical protein
MPGSPIPALDPAPLPGPPWLFHALWLVTFFVHLVFMNAVLGGTILAAAIGTRDAGREVRTLLVGINSWAISLAITFGIAPLLFLQVLYGRFFYSATVLVAWWWLGMLGLLTLGYYLNYVAKFRLASDRPVSLVLWIEAWCFVAIAAIQVVVNLLHLQPARWGAVARSSIAAFADPSFVPRFLHFLLAAVSMSAALLALLGVRRAARGLDATLCRDMARFGVSVALYATVAQILVGFWLVLALPGDVLRAFMRGGAATMGPLAIAVLAAVGLLVVLARIRDPLAEPRMVRHSAELIVLAMLVMTVTRHQIRGLYLAPARAGEAVAVATQWGPLVLFLAVFVLCVGLTVFAIVRAVRDRPASGEKAA